MGVATRFASAAAPRSLTFHLLFFCSSTRLLLFNRDFIVLSRRASPRNNAAFAACGLGNLRVAQMLQLYSVGGGQGASFRAKIHVFLISILLGTAWAQAQPSQGTAALNSGAAKPPLAEASQAAGDAERFSIIVIFKVRTNFITACPLFPFLSIFKVLLPSLRAHPLYFIFLFSGFEKCFIFKGYLHSKLPYIQTTCRSIRSPR